MRGAAVVPLTDRPMRWRGVVIALATLIGVAVTARLGLWQLDRAHQRESAAERVTQRATAPVLTTLPPLPQASPAPQAGALDPALEPWLARRVQLAGRWSTDDTVVLDNRALAGRAGFIVVTPLVLDDGRAVLVQRGWLPRDLRDRTRVPAFTSASGRVEVAGRLAPPPSRLYEFESAASGRLRQNLDPVDFARETGLRVVTSVSVLQADTPPFAGDGLRRDWPAPDSGAAKNRGYAAQWFGLAALMAGLYVWFQLVRPWRSRA